ncbi:MAG TPA: tRNA 2-thiocytidine(32) synthetase TtcA [Spirochaetia bacterium]|nr:MAG: hypothetical protein A2Y41_09250 [Spirochaetes bacterium GWB1_36_13]HCL58061.1 tRNA 2-thiocytidine(32) synthetase TtcA [Spirochaetia bacterium]
MPRLERKARKKFGAAIVAHKMIEEGDTVLIAVSGGKDSLLMVKLFADFQKKAPIDFKIIACHLKNELTEPALREKTAAYVEQVFKDLNIPYIIKNLPTVSESKKDKPVSCFWCSWLRRTYLFKIAKDMGIKKLALGHHKDDMIETFLMNLFYHGKLSTMPMKLQLFKGDLSIIRPLGLLLEKEIAIVSQEMGFIPATCLCAFAGNTKRNSMKEMISEIEKEVKSVKTNLFNACDFSNIEKEYLN